MYSDSQAVRKPLTYRNGISKVHRQKTVRIIPQSCGSRSIGRLCKLRQLVSFIAPMPQEREKKSTVIDNIQSLMRQQNLESWKIFETQMPSLPPGALSFSLSCLGAVHFPAAEAGFKGSPPGWGMKSCRGSIPPPWRLLPHTRAESSRTNCKENS